MRLGRIRYTVGPGRISDTSETYWQHWPEQCATRALDYGRCAGVAVYRVGDGDEAAAVCDRCMPEAVRAAARLGPVIVARLTPG